MSNKNRSHQPSYDSVKIKKERISRALTQEEFANVVGVTRQTVVGWETGRHPVPTVRAYQIAKMLADYDGRK